MHKLVTELLNQHHPQRFIPIDVVSIALSLGVQLIPFPEEERVKTGWFKVHDGKITFFYNSKDTHIRRRYSIAFQIAQAALNQGYQSKATTADDYGLNSEKQENIEANDFAINLLVPKPFLRHYATEKNVTIADLSKIFFVSEVAIRTRLIRDGLISK